MITKAQITQRAERDGVPVQTEVLARTRARVEELEKELEALMARLESDDH